MKNWLKNLWSTKSKYQLDQDVYDERLGFEVLSNPSVFLTWDINYIELLTYDLGQIKKNYYDQNIFTFKFPVRIGQIVVKKLNIYFDHVYRKDVAIQHYFAYLEHDYEYIKDIWQTYTVVNHAHNYERVDQKSWNFNIGDQLFNLISYQKDETHLTIRNLREYPEKLKQDDYDEVADISKRVELNSYNEIRIDYRQNDQVRKNLNRLTCTTNTIWLDKSKQLMGFSGKKYAIIFPEKCISKLIISNLIPAKGAGGAWLGIQLTSGENHTIYMSEYSDFDAYVDILSETLGVEVMLLPPQFDC